MSALSQLTPSPITSKINPSVNCAANVRTFFGKNSTAMQLSLQQVSTNAFKLRQHPYGSKSSQPCRFNIDHNGNKNGGETVKLHRYQCPRSASSSRQLLSKAPVNGSGAAFIADAGSVSPGAPFFGGSSLPDDISTSVADIGTLSGTEVPASDPGAWSVQSELSGSISGIDQSDLKSVKELADSDSRFVPFRGVDIHYKQAEPFSLASPSDNEILGTGGTLMLGTPAVLLHGFGASLFSWHRILSPIATLLGCPAVAFDRPAFGLTERVKPPGGSRQSSTPPKDNPYSATFSADCTRAFSSYLLSAFPARPARKVILIAHSAGAAIAAQAVLESPTLAAALVLIGPALAPLLVSPFTKGKQYKGALWPLRLALDAIKAVLGLITIRAALGIFSAARYISRLVRNFTPQDGPASGQAANEGSASANGIISRVPRRVGALLSTLAILAYARLCLLVLYVGKNLHLGWTGAQGIRTAAWAAGLRSGIGRWMVWGTT